MQARIVKLEPVRVASVHGFGQTPEEQAWQKLVDWAGPRGFLDDLEHHRIFGFNHPNPSPGSPNYGYELWITVGPEVTPESGVEVKDFPGGLYAVMRCAGPGDPYTVIPAAWQALVVWHENSQHKSAAQPCLEEHIRSAGKGIVTTPGGDWALDLYLPIAE